MSSSERRIFSREEKTISSIAFRAGGLCSLYAALVIYVGVSGGSWLPMLLILGLFLLPIIWGYFLEYVAASEVAVEGECVHFQTRKQNLTIPISSLRILPPKPYLPRRAGFVGEDLDTGSRAWVLSDTLDYQELLSLMEKIGPARNH